MIAAVEVGKVTPGAETVSNLLDMWLEQGDSIGHSPRKSCPPTTTPALLLGYGTRRPPRSPDPGYGDGAVTN